MSDDTACACTRWYMLFDAAMCSPASLVADTHEKLHARWHRHNDGDLTLDDIARIEAAYRECDPTHGSRYIGTIRL